MKKTLARLSLVIAIVVISALAIRPGEVWRLAAGPADLGRVDFKGFTAASSPNTFLLCPKDICTSHPYKEAAPEFALDADVLMSKAIGLWRAEPRVEMVDQSPADLTVRFVQRSALLKFPDTISVQFYALADNRSTLAIYSRSQIGYDDLGANEARVLRWMSMLEQAGN